MGTHGQRRRAVGLNDATGVSRFDVYRGHTALRPPHPLVGGVNSGVMLWNLHALRAHGGTLLRELWATVTRVLAARVPEGGGHPRNASWVAAVEAASPLPDQEVLNAVLSPAHHPEWLSLLPSRWNACLELFVPHADLRAAGVAPPRPPCLVHFCGRSLQLANFAVDGSPPFNYVCALYVYLSQALLGDDSPAPGAATVPGGAAAAAPAG